MSLRYVNLNKPDGGNSPLSVDRTLIFTGSLKGKRITYMIKEDLKMSKAIASVAVLVFAGFLCSSMLAVFHRAALDHGAWGTQAAHPYFMAY